MIKNWIKSLVNKFKALRWQWDNRNMVEDTHIYEGEDN
jgi:hypothetical protein